MKLGRRISQGLRAFFGAPLRLASRAKARVQQVSVQGSGVIDSTRSVTMRQRAEMRTYGPIQNALDQYVDPLTGAKKTVEIDGVENEESAAEITTDLQEELDRWSRDVTRKAVRGGLSYGVVYLNPWWTDDLLSIAGVASADPSGCVPLYDDKKNVVGFRSWDEGRQVDLINEGGWLDSIVATYDSEYGEVPGRALTDRVYYWYRFHRALVRLLQISASNLAMPTIVVDYPDTTEANDAGETTLKYESSALDMGKKLDQDEKRYVITLPQPPEGQEGPAKWAVSLLESARGPDDLIKLESLVLKRIYGLLGVPPELLINEDARGSQARATIVHENFVARKDGLADDLAEPVLTIVLQAVADHRYGEGVVQVKVGIETLNTTQKDLLTKVFVTALQSKAGLDQLKRGGFDLAQFAEIGLVYDAELVEEPEEPDEDEEGGDKVPPEGKEEGAKLGAQRLKLAAEAGPDGEQMKAFTAKILPRLVTIIGGAKGKKGGLLAKLETAYRATVKTGEPINLTPNLESLVKWGNSVRVKAREIARKAYAARGLENDAEKIVARADAWCSQQVEYEVTRLWNRLVEKTTSAGRAANGRPNAPQAANTYWERQVLSPAQGDALRFAEQLGPALLGKYREALVAFA